VPLENRGHFVSEIITRRATESDRADIAQMIVCSFHDNFSKLSEELDNVAKALEKGIRVERFLIAEDGAEAVGVIACSDSSGRAVDINMANCRKHLGFIIGTISGIVMAAEFSKPLHYPHTVGYIEFVAVAESVRKKGIATKMLRSVIDQTDYMEYILDVADNNTVAQHCYLKFGFAEIERVKVCLSKQKGFSSKVYMKYVKQNKDVLFISP
jgi:ribosomal protein S18 acetylase RimI-like enzyme